MVSFSTAPRTGKSRTRVKTTGMERKIVSAQFYWRWLGSFLIAILSFAGLPRLSAATSPLPDKAYVRIVQPKAGTSFPVRSPVIIGAEAVDPAGDIRHLDFFANGTLIGSSDFLARIATVPGRPIPHRLEWHNVAAGNYRLVARGKDVQGESVESAVVDIEVVGESSDLPVVRLEATRAETAEPTPESRVAPGEFKLQRSGDPAKPLTVFLRISGTATPGADYEEIPGTVEIPAGKSGVSLFVAPIFDALKEETETVIAALVAPGEDPSAGLHYRVDREHAIARVHIRDGSRPSVATLTLDSPRSGARFAVGTTVALEATAIDPQGAMTRVEFLDGEESIGVSEIVFIQPPEPGQPIHHSLEWKDAALGIHMVRARSTSAAGDAVISEPVVIWILEDPDHPRFPTVSIEATQKVTSEPLPAALVLPGEFTVRRDGSLERPLEVYLRYSGTADSQDINPALPEHVLFEPDQREVKIRVMAAADDAVEGTERIVATLVQTESADGRLPGYIVDPERSSAVVDIRDEDRLTFATLEITAPESGSHFPEGVPIVIEAFAIDPKGYIGRVEFFASGKSIGVSEINFIRAPDPGTPIPHTFEWQSASEGDHRVVARALDSDGVAVESRPVHIQVGQSADQIALSVQATDSVATEPRIAGGDPAMTDNGVFVIQRVAGPGNVAVSFSYSLGGSAANGRDYRELSGEGTLAAGEDSVEIIVQPLADDLKERTERVELTLRPLPCIQIFPPPPECYRIVHETAVVEIRDSSDGNSQGPEVTITEPRSGSVFEAGKPIKITTVAEASSGSSIAKIEIAAGDKILGTSVSSPLSVEWNDARVGIHKLIATATDDAGNKSESRAVVIYVRDPAERAFVRRLLPPAYLPGGLLEVRLLAIPPRGAGAWIAEEQPPQGWTVSNISDEGVLDTATMKVKFGPYTDGKERELSYQVVPPDGTTGEQLFTGASSLDGEAFPIAGDKTIKPAGEYHPADREPQNKSLSADEVTSYAAAWKAGRTWGEDSASIPLSYVARAGFLWKAGEAYAFDPAAGAPPECWVPASSAPPGGAVVAGKTISGHGDAHREPPVVWLPGLSGEVYLDVTPPPGTKALAVEEIVPPGWHVIDASDGGLFDRESGRVRWGILPGDQPRRLTFKVVPPSGSASTGAFAGYASFDGVNVKIAGPGWVGAADSHSRLKITGSRRADAGKVHLNIEALPNQVFVVEASSDLVTWTEIQAHLFTGDEVEVNDDAAVAGAEHRYYRLRPVSR